MRISDWSSYLCSSDLQLGSFLPGVGLGGAGIHWNGQTWRFLPSDFRLRSHIRERYGDGFIPEGLTIQDWGITYEELEPYYDHFERVCGIGGRADRKSTRLNSSH